MQAMQVVGDISPLWHSNIGLFAPKHSLNYHVGNVTIAIQLIPMVQHNFFALYVKLSRNHKKTEHILILWVGKFHQSLYWFHFTTLGTSSKIFIWTIIQDYIRCTEHFLCVFTIEFGFILQFYVTQAAYKFSRIYINFLILFSFYSWMYYQWRDIWCGHKEFN